MRTLRTKQFESAEPVGIVIADGGHGNVASRLAAFVWGPVPDDLLDELDAAATRDALRRETAHCEPSRELMFAGAV